YTQHNPQRPFKRDAEGGDALRTQMNAQLRVLKLASNGFGHGGDAAHTFQLEVVKDGLEAGLKLLPRGARSKPAQDPKPIPVSRGKRARLVVHHGRNPHVDESAGLY